MKVESIQNINSENYSPKKKYYNFLSFNLITLSVCCLTTATLIFLNFDNHSYFYVETGSSFAYYEFRIVNGWPFEVIRYYTKKTDLPLYFDNVKKPTGRTNTGIKVIVVGGIDRIDSAIENSLDYIKINHELKGPHFSFISILLNIVFYLALMLIIFCIVQFKLVTFKLRAFVFRKPSSGNP